MQEESDVELGTRPRVMDIERQSTSSAAARCLFEVGIGAQGKGQLKDLEDARAEESPGRVRALNYPEAKDG